MRASCGNQSFDLPVRHLQKVDFRSRFFRARVRARARARLLFIVEIRV